MSKEEEKPAAATEEAQAEDATAEAPVVAEDAKKDASKKKEAEEPKALERVARPDSDAKEAKVKELTSQIETLIEERGNIDKQQQVVRAGNKPFNDKRRALVDQLKKLRESRKKLLDEAQEMRNKVEAHFKKEKQMREKEKQMKDQLRFSSVKEVDDKLAAMERKHETSALSKEEEKALMKEMQALRATRRKVEEFVKNRTGKTDGADDVSTLKAEANARRAEADKFKGQIEALSKELDQLTADNKEAYGKADKLQKKRTEIQKKINKLVGERDDVKKAFSKQWTVFKKYMTALNKQRDAERKAREEEYRKQKEEYLKKLEEEEMAKKPWEGEIALCDMLITYLNKLANPSASTGKKETVAKDEAAGTRKGADDFDGFKAIGKKNTEEGNFLVMGSGKPKKKKSNNKKKDAARLFHPLDTLQSFVFLGLKAPAKAEDIPASIKELQEKRAYYDVLPRAPKKDKKDKDAAAAATAEEGDSKKKKGGKAKKMAAPTLESAELFPVLPGSKSPTSPPAAPTEGPSAVDMVKSSGSTPKAAAAPTPQEQAAESEAAAESAE